MPKEIAWLCSLASSPLFAHLSPADKKLLVDMLTQGTRTLRDFEPPVPFGLN